MDGTNVQVGNLKINIYNCADDRTKTNGTYVEKVRDKENSKQVNIHFLEWNDTSQYSSHTELLIALNENTGRNPFNLSPSNFSLGTLPKARETSSKVNYWDIIKVKSFWIAKETVNKTKGQ